MIMVKDRRRDVVVGCCCAVELSKRLLCQSRVRGKFHTNSYIHLDIAHLSDSDTTPLPSSIPHHGHIILSSSVQYRPIRFISTKQ